MYVEIYLFSADEVIFLHLLLPISLNLNIWLYYVNTAGLHVIQIIAKELLTDVFN